MDFKSIGSISGLMKNMKLEGEWSRKKKSGDFQSESKKSELQRKNEQFKADYKRQQEENPGDKTLEGINNKIAVGAELSPEEMRYLQSKNPTLYQKLKNLENEKKSYEREIKRCKTKEDVERLRMSKVSSSLSAINSVKNNPNIPESKKLEVAQNEMKRLSELEKIEAKFVKSGGYAKLPTEQELRKAEKDMELAKEAEKEKVSSRDKDSATEKSDAPKTDCIMSEEKEKAAQNTGDDRPTEIEAELTPEAQKVKRSKAKAAYNDAKKLEPQTIYIQDPVSSSYTISNISEKYTGEK